MKSTQLLVTNSHANCNRCGHPTEFPIFESGPGGDFATFLGETTGSLYRVSLGQIYYLGKTMESLLAPAIEREGSSAALRPLPENVLCKVCGNVFSAPTVPVDSEGMVAAFEL